MVAQIRLRDASSTLRTVARIRMRDETGELRTIQRVRMRDTSGVLQTVYQAMTAEASPDNPFNTASTSTITTNSSTATPTGGTAPYTYLWQAATYNEGAIAITTPTAATTTFRRTGCFSGDVYIGDFFCTVTDALGVVAVTNIVNVTIART
jgi:hypothetical protein